MFRIRVETEFSRNFRKSSPIVQAIDFTERHLGGAGVWEVNFPAPPELSEDFLEQVRDLAQKLRELPGVESQSPGPRAAAGLAKVTAITDATALVPSRMVLIN